MSVDRRSLQQVTAILRPPMEGCYTGGTGRLRISYRMEAYPQTLLDVNYDSA